MNVIEDSSFDVGLSRHIFEECGANEYMILLVKWLID